VLAVEVASDRFEQNRNDEALHSAVGGTQRIGPKTPCRSLVNQCHMLFPGIELPCRLAEVVIDQLAPGRIGKSHHQTILQLGITSAATLDGPGSQLAQHVSDR
jgi:hypothetical protein